MVQYVLDQWQYVLDIIDKNHNKCSTFYLKIEKI